LKQIQGSAAELATIQPPSISLFSSGKMVICHNQLNITEFLGQVGNPCGLLALCSDEYTGLAGDALGKAMQKLLAYYSPCVVYYY
jgi:hypothetical protein